jgi:hypothetical protein
MTPEQIAKSGTESAEQQALMAWCAMQSDRRLDLLFAIPNGGERGDGTAKGRAIAGGKMVAEGVKAGVPDLMLPVMKMVPDNSGYHDYAGLFIELKRLAHKNRKDGNCSAAQLAWHDALRAQGYRVEVCFGWIEARDILLDYLA